MSMLGLENIVQQSSSCRVEYNGTLGKLSLVVLGKQVVAPVYLKVPNKTGKELLDPELVKQWNLFLSNAQAVIGQASQDILSACQTDYNNVSSEKKQLTLEDVAKAFVKISEIVVWNRPIRGAYGDEKKASRESVPHVLISLEGKNPVFDGEHGLQIVAVNGKYFCRTTL